MSDMILISECLAGIPCRMDGKSKMIPELKALLDSGEAVVACPEVLGGLPTHRDPSERQGERVVSCTGISSIHLSNRRKKRA